MAEVYVARRDGPFGFAKQVALKRILPELTSDPDFVAMFIDEARMCARLSHPNVVSVFDFGEEGGELYMAMEYVEGTTAARLIRAAASRGLEIPLEVVMHLGLSVLRGLDYAHSLRDDKGVPLSLVHRDVSPGNLLIDRNGAVKIADFGIARAAEFERRTEAGQLKGKLGYMSPEQVSGRELDARSDLFTTGIVLAELCTLKPLFSGGTDFDVLLRIRDAELSTLDRAGHRVPDDVRQVLLRALARDRGDRFPSARSFAEALEEIVRRRRLQMGPAPLVRLLERLELVQRPVRRKDSEAPRANGQRSIPPASFDHEPATTPAIAYRVRMLNGDEVGPLPYPRLVELFVTGRIGVGCLVSREGGPFEAAKTFPELHRFVSSSAMRWEDGIPVQASLRGPLDRFRLPRMLLRLALGRETGALYLHDGARKKKLFIVEGRPEFVASTDAKELLGELLVHRGQVLPMEVDMALALLPQYGGRIGDALVGLGVLRPIELFRAIALQTETRFLEIFEWTSGEIGFVSGLRSHEETFPLAVDTVELVLRGVRECYAAKEIEGFLTPYLGSVLSPVRPSPVRPDAFRLAAREERVVVQLTSDRCLGDFLASVVPGDAPEDARRAVFMAVSLGLFDLGGWTRSPSGKPLSARSSG